MQLMFSEYQELWLVGFYDYSLNNLVIGDNCFLS